MIIASEKKVREYKSTAMRLVNADEGQDEASTRATAEDIMYNIRRMEIERTRIKALKWVLGEIESL